MILKTLSRRILSIAQIRHQNCRNIFKFSGRYSIFSVIKTQSFSILFFPLEIEQHRHRHLWNSEARKRFARTLCSRSYCKTTLLLWGRHSWHVHIFKSWNQIAQLDRRYEKKLYTCGEYFGEMFDHSQGKTHSSDNVFMKYFKFIAFSHFN